MSIPARRAARHGSKKMARLSPTDMANWTDLGSPMNLYVFRQQRCMGRTVSQKRQIYYYVPMRPKSGGWAIGVAVATSPTGPFTDALGHPLVSNNDYYIDPTVFVDDDGQAYMYWGNPYLYKVKLNEDMVSTSGSVTQIAQTAESVGNIYGEGPWLSKRSGLYYLIFSSDGNPNENIRYSTSSSPIGPWTYKDIIMPAKGETGPTIQNCEFRNSTSSSQRRLAGRRSWPTSVCVNRSTQYRRTFPTIKIPAGQRRLAISTPSDHAGQKPSHSPRAQPENCGDTGGPYALIHNGGSTSRSASTSARRPPSRHGSHQARPPAGASSSASTV
jgi:hypothetical protein